MRFVELSEEEIKNISCFNQKIVGDAKEIDFYLSGEVMGESSGNRISEGEHLKRAGRMLKGRGWVEEISMEVNQTIFKSDIEIDRSLGRTSCNIIRRELGVMTERTIREFIEVEEVKSQILSDEYSKFETKKKEFEG